MYMKRPSTAYGDDATTAIPPATDASSTASETTTQKIDDFAKGSVVSTGAGVALVYHGYKRTGSIIWALLYGLAGREIPLIALPVAIAQGFGKRKPCP